MSGISTVIPCAGLGTRMLPLSAAVPKELLPMGDRPLLQWTVAEARATGCTDVVIVTSPEKMFSSFVDGPVRYADKLAAGSPASQEALALARTMRYSFALQSEPRGLGHAVLQARGHVNGAQFWVQLPDEWYPDQTCMPQMQRALAEAQAVRPGIDAAIAVMEVPAPEVERYGIARPDPGLTSGHWFGTHALVEKPRMDQAPSRWAIIGRYLLPASLFDILETTAPGRGGEIQLTDALDQLARQGRLICVPFAGARHDTGSVETYATAWQAYLAGTHT